MTENQVLTYRLQPWQMELCKQQAKRAELGGHSHIRDSASRDTMLPEDQLVGQIGELVVNRHLLGGLKLYLVSRTVANRTPERGDGGGDIIGSNIDVKSSCWRNKDKPLVEYNLVVRPGERQPGTVYILVMVELKQGRAHILGWATDDMLPDDPVSAGVFSGARLLSARELNPIIPIKWFGS